jgi:uncharacterized protein YcfJ
MKSRYKVLVAMLGVAGMLPLANAYGYDDYAYVTRVSPRVEQVNEPQQSCHTEHYQVQGEHHWFRSDEPTIIYQGVERCETVNHVATHTTGYDVTYDYHGHSYTTQMAYDPGTHVRISVDVLPHS